MELCFAVGELRSWLAAAPGQIEAGMLAKERVTNAVGSWHYIWKASHDADAAAEECRGLSTRATAQGRLGSGLKLRSRSVHGGTDSAKQSAIGENPRMT
jgi:hypothetical protein